VFPEKNTNRVRLRAVAEQDNLIRAVTRKYVNCLSVAHRRLRNEITCNNTKGIICGVALHRLNTYAEVPACFSATIFGINVNRRTFRLCFIAALWQNLANANDIIRATLMHDDYDHEDTENARAEC